jgi:uncharacterized protein
MTSFILTGRLAGHFKENSHMDFELSQPEARVLGSLLEKEMATPEYYPLSLNGLINACNQKSNREPVVSYDEATVVGALAGLRQKRLVWLSDASRVPKYAQNLSKTLNLLRKEAALLCLLLLRGPQTPGELRSRSERLFDFVDLEDVLRSLGNLEEMGLVRNLPRQPGHKESRFMQLLSGEPEEAALAAQASPPAKRAGDERFATLENEVAELKIEVARLRQELQDFKNQF